MPGTDAVVLLVVALVVIGLIVLGRGEARRWVEFRGFAGHRPEELARVLAGLRRDGVRFRTRNAVALGTETAMGAGLSTTILVHRDDLEAARRTVAEPPADAG